MSPNFLTPEREKNPTEKQTIFGKIDTEKNTKKVHSK